MSISNPIAVKNRVLSMLTNAEYLQLKPMLELVELDKQQVLYTPGNAVKYIYFPNNCIVSLLYDVDPRRTIEIAMKGNESVVGIIACLGGFKSFNLTVVRESGTAMRLSVEALRLSAKNQGSLPVLLDKSVHALVTQLAQLAVCSRFHSVDARLIRWLLMTRDRVGPHQICATQESIAGSLGLRRSGVTATASQLKRQAVIEYRRGRISILDEDRLQAAACGCYGIIKRQYDSFLR